MKSKEFSHIDISVMLPSKRKESESNELSESGESNAWSDSKQKNWAACPRLGKAIDDKLAPGSIPSRVTFIPCKPPLKADASDAFDEGERYNETSIYFL